LKVPRDVTRNPYRRDMWIIEMWHGFVLVLSVAWGIAAFLGLSCVAMAGLDGAEDEDAAYAAPARLP
jgi:hypothetical protein